MSRQDSLTAVLSGPVPILALTVLLVMRAGSPEATGESAPAGEMKRGWSCCKWQGQRSAKCHWGGHLLSPNPYLFTCFLKRCPGKLAFLQREAVLLVPGQALTTREEAVGYADRPRVPVWSTGHRSAQGGGVGGHWLLPLLTAPHTSPGWGCGHPTMGLTPGKARQQINEHSSSLTSPHWPLMGPWPLPPETHPRLLPALSWLPAWILELQSLTGRSPLMG